jgi:hypothetical protein
MSYDLSKFIQSIPHRAQPYAQALINAALRVPVPEIDAFILAALIERESGSGVFLSPPGPGGTGDNGFGHGLAQIDSRSFGQWLANHPWQDPFTNINFGAQLLYSDLILLAGKNPIHGLTDGNLVMVSPGQAAKRGVSPGQYNDPRPVQGELLLKAALASYNTGCGNVTISMACGLDPDFTTTPGSSGHPDYGADVINRANQFRANYNG